MGNSEALTGFAKKSRIDGVSGLPALGGIRRIDSSVAHRDSLFLEFWLSLSDASHAESMDLRTSQEPRNPRDTLGKDYTLLSLHVPSAPWIWSDRIGQQQTISGLRQSDPGRCSAFRFAFPASSR